MTTKHTAKKRFGQNFLTDQYVINEIIRIIAPQKGDNVLEIGPGFGALTIPLLNILPILNVIEIDRDIVTFLRDKFPNKLIIHQCDALKFEFSSFTNVRIIGNLPYNISTPLLFHLHQFNNILDMHFMLQKEVVDRICAVPNNKSYGRLSIMMQYKYDCYKMLDVNNKSFYPAPKVESAIIKIVPSTKYDWQNINTKKLNFVVSHAFNQRRKTINNSLKNVIPNDVFELLKIDKNKRAENISIQDYIQLSQFVNIEHKPLTNEFIDVDS